MQTEFPFVVITAKQRKFTGEPDEGTRIYRMEGPEEDLRAWFEAITEAFGPTVSPGGVTMFAPVSRAAVYKRLKQGNLSAFAFQIVEKTAGPFGRSRVRRETPYLYIPVSECQAWGDLLKTNAEERSAATDFTKKDWSSDFLEKKRRK